VNARSPTPSFHPPYGHATVSSTPQVGVGAHLHDLTDEQREEAIAQLTKAMEAAWAKWINESCFASRGDADRFRQERDDLLRSRSPAQVARMEADLQARIERSPGATRSTC
jgi:hypothetical protein